MFTSLATALLLVAKLEFVVPDASFSLREGLPAIQVLSLCQDRYGGLWAGTTAGLARLGGPVIQTFGAEEGLSRSAVFAVAEEPSGAIVAGTAGGIFRMEDGHRFERVALPAVAAQLAVRRFGRGPDGGLWALAGDRTLLRLLGGQWHAVGIDGALAFEATDFTIDQGGALWLATRNHGLLRFIASGTRFQKSAQYQDGLDAKASIDHVAAARGKVYFTTARGLSSVSIAAGGSVETVPFPPAASAGHRALAVTAVGRVFLGTNAGIFTLRDNRLVPLPSRNDRARAAAVTLLSDREGQLWVGTAENGLNLLLMGRGVSFLRSEKESFRSIDIDKNAVHWVSNARRVVTFRTDGQGNPIDASEARFEGFDALTIYGTAEDPDGGLFFAMEGGVGLLPRARRDAKALVVQRDSRFEALRDRLVTGIHTDSRGAVWAISSVGVYRLGKGAREAQAITLPDGNPWMAAMDSNGRLWISTRQGGMALVDTLTESVAAVPLPGNRQVEFVGPAPDGGVVVTFENGESAFFQSKDGRTVISSGGPSGISWLSVLSLQKMGDYYLAAHGGDRLSQLSLAPPRVEQTILTSADLEDSDFRYLALREGRAGQVWFTLLNGIGLLDPPNAPPAPSRLRILPNLETFSLLPRPNALDVHAELSDPVAPRKARYRFRLIGQNDTWAEWSADPHIPLSNIAPGDYQLEIEAEDRYGRKSSPVSLPVIARGHVWESWPARIAAGLLIAGIAYLLYQGRVRAIEQDRLDLAAAVKAGRGDLEIANQRLSELSLTDMLTGLRNRRYFSEVVESEVRLLKRRFDERRSLNDPNRDAVYFLLDLDRFKAVNDLFGHAGGDAVLKETARRLHDVVRKTDHLIRWGGEEFLILSLDCQREESPDIATRIMKAISEAPYPVGPPEGTFVTTSIGWAAYPFDTPGVAEPNPEDVVRLADRALYRAKRAGRNCAVGITPVGEESPGGGVPPGTIEVLKDLGIAVSFRMVRGVVRESVDEASARGTGPTRRPV